MFTLNIDLHRITLLPANDKRQSYTQHDPRKQDKTSELNKN